MTKISMTNHVSRKVIRTFNILYYLINGELFLVGAFCETKMPDSYSDFFLPTTDLTPKGPLFTEFLWASLERKLWCFQTVPPLGTIVLKAFSVTRYYKKFRFTSFLAL